MSAAVIAASVGLAGAGQDAARAEDKPAAFKSGYAPVNGLRMYYEIHGSRHGSEPPLVLLHGGGSTIETSFGLVLSRFAKDREVIAFDQQGHGRTADVDRPFSFTQSADDAAALTRYLKVEKADFLGFSNGATIALEIAIRHPEMVRKLVPISGMYRHDGAAPAFWGGLEKGSVETMPEELKADYRRTAPHPEQLPEFFRKSRDRMLHFEDIPAEAMRGIAAPALVINGDADVPTLEHGVEITKLLPHAELAILPGTNHAQMMTRADWVVSMVEEFLRAPMPVGETRR
jgi:pimeloyl-ACP methyl ester carboxylesterase